MPSAARIFSSNRGGSRNRDLTFRTMFENNGVDKLDPAILINSVRVTPLLRYKGGDAAATGFTAWGFGETLTLQGGTVPSYNNGSPLLGLNDDTVKFNDGGFFKGTDGTNQVTTGDFLLEWIGVQTADAARRVYSSSEGQTDVEVGIELWQQNNKMYLNLTKADPAFVQVISAALTVGTWNHCICFIDRSGSGQWYVNGVASGPAVDVSAYTDSLVNSGRATQVGGHDSTGSTHRTAYLAIHEGTATWFDTHLQAAVALERFQKLIGIYPFLSKGTATPVAARTGRAFDAYLDKQEGAVHKPYRVGDGWLRVCERLDTNGISVKGLLVEPEVENKCLQSEDVATTWTKSQGGDSFDLNSVAAPNGEETADGLIATSANAEHGIQQDVTLTAVRWTFSIFAKAGDTSWLHMHDHTIANGEAFFNLTTCVVGTVQSGVIARMEEWGNGWCRCSITMTGTAAAHDLEIHTATADGTDQFQGDGASVNTYLWGGQVEIGEFMSSYIPTVAGHRTRLADTLEYKGDDGNLGGVGSEGAGTIKCDVLIPSYNNATELGIITLSDAGTAADQIKLSVGTDDALDLISAASGGSAGAAAFAGDVTNNTKICLRAHFANNHLSINKDGSQGVADTTVTVPNDLDRISVSQDRDEGAQLGGLISNLEIHKKRVR